MDKNFLYAIATLTGTIIGVGLFSLPYITARVGIWVMLFYFLFLGMVVVLGSLLYGEVVLRTKSLHRFPGYAEKYLGKWGKGIAFLVSGLGLVGAILAYLIVGGQFLFSLLEPIFGGSYFAYVLLYFSAGAILIYFGIKSIAQTELFALFLFFAVLLFVFLRGFSFIRIDNLFVFDSTYLFLPYGPILFSLAASGVIAEVKEMLKENPADLKKVIIWSTVTAAVTYLFFILIVLGITGQQTSVEAIAGLKSFFGDGVVTTVLLFGLLTTFTSFLTLGLTLKKTLWYDFGFKKNLAWFVACFVPLLLFVIGLKDFIVIISLVGGVALAIRTIIMILMYFKAKTKGDLIPAYSISLPRLITYSLIVFFVLGAVYEIVYFVK